MGRGTHECDRLWRVTPIALCLGCALKFGHSPRAVSAVWLCSLKNARCRQHAANRTYGFHCAAGRLPVGASNTCAGTVLGVT